MAHKAERLVNLTVALLEARRPLTFQEIRDRTRYYTQVDPETGRRMFERDKDELRRLGVPVETRSVDVFDSEHGYLVDRSAYALPDVDLDASEIAALAIALRVTGQEQARLGLVKLAARAPDPAEVDAPVATVSLGLEAVEAVADALLERQAVRFDYRTAGGEAGRRTVDPYAVVQRRGHWYLVGRDHDRDAVRAFRIDRFASRPRAVGQPDAFAVPEDLDASAYVAGPEAERADAEVALAPEVTWEADARGGVPVEQRDDGWWVYRFRGVPAGRLLSWALGLGADAEVLAPPALRARARDHLAALAEGGP